MARDDGFAIADISTAYFDDAKVRRLWRLLEPDGPAMTEALALHLATVLASWRDGKRVSASEAAPLYLPVRPAIVARLVEVGLLDRSERIPARSWRSYNDPAVERREARRAAGRKGGEAKAKRSSSVAVAELKRRSTRPADRPVRPSVPSDKPSSPRSRSPEGDAAPRGGDPVSFKEAMAASGYAPEKGAKT